MKSSAALAVLSVLVSACHMAKTSDDQIAAAKVAVAKAAAEDPHIIGKPVIVSIGLAKVEGSSLLGTVCGAFTDSGVPEAARIQRRFIYMAVDGEAVIEIAGDDPELPSTVEERKLTREALAAFVSAWSDSCD